MKKVILTSALVLASFSAQADIIKCVFTEPFINSSYSMTQSTLTYTGTEASQNKVIKNVSFQIRSAGVFQLVSKEGKVLQTLVLNRKGSDGMSNVVYPYSVKDSEMKSGANSGIGGCTSNKLKATGELD